MDFEKKINFIIFKIHEKRKETNAPKLQTILISATLTNGVKEIARRLNVSDAVNIDSSESDNLNEKKNLNESQTEDEHIALPAGLKNSFMIVPSKLRLVGLISFILNKFVVSFFFSFFKLLKFNKKKNDLNFSIKQKKKQKK